MKSEPDREKNGTCASPATAFASLEHDIAINKQVADSSSLIITVLLYYILPVLLMWGLLSLVFRKMGKGGPMGVGKSNAKVYVQKETGITFQDVAGEDEAKESLVAVP